MNTMIYVNESTVTKLIKLFNMKKINLKSGLICDWVPE